MSFAELAAQLAEIGRQCHARGWALGTSGNFSAVVSRDPLRLAITASGVDKGTLGAGEIVEIDGHGQVVAGSGRPSTTPRTGPPQRRGSRRCWPTDRMRTGS